MCNQKTTKGVKCLISPNRDICHIHKKQLLLKHSKNEIKNLNNTIIKKNNKISTLCDKSKSLKEEVNSLTNEDKELLLKINEMNKDFQNYATIKQFEYMKSKLCQNVCDITDKCELKLFCKDKSNETILIDIFGKQLDYWKYYNKLRLERNSLCHLYE
jgi:hypothetical protein